MTKLNAKSAPIGAQCKCDRRSFSVDLSEITPDGCSAKAPAGWAEDFEFLRLRIADNIDINGRVLRHKGRRAVIRFFGQIHPTAIAKLAAATA